MRDTASELLPAGTVPSELVAACFQGLNGATSLKAEIVGHFPTLADAAAFRGARYLLQEKLGGAMAIKEEIAAAGYVGPDGKLALGEHPCNIFARIAAGVERQPTVEHEQEALGKLQERFQVCCNRTQEDLHWDSTDPNWVKRSSMSRRHRFLTTKDLHWQWFNPLVFGLVPEEDGGASASRALEETEAMKTAALEYARNAGGWSDEVGLFVNVFGHNNVQSLFVHILDMSCTGPSFQHFQYKMCPLDAVLKVLAEDASLATVRRPTVVNNNNRRDASRSRRILPIGAGIGGATSIKAALVEQVPVLRDASGFRKARRLLTSQVGGTPALREELAWAGFLGPTGSKLTTGTQPLNVFARIAAGLMVQPGMAEEQEFLGRYKDKYVVCSNRPENDEHWDSEDPEWVGKASMSRRHRFLTTRDLHWQWFNALVFGLVSPDEGGVGPAEALAEAENIRDAALTYADNAGWSENVGLYVHVFGHNSVNSLHVHILDLDAIGPTGRKFEYKNCPLDAVIKVLKEEAETNQGRSRTPESRRTSLFSRTSRTSRSSREALPRSWSASRAGRPTVALGPTPEPIFQPFLRGSGDALCEILELNVGGRCMTVSRGTLMHAPKGSLLRTMFDPEGGGTDTMMRDCAGRIFLDLPPGPFETLMDRLRLLRFAHQTRQQVALLEAPTSQNLELRSLARLLGVERVLLANGGDAEAN